jgi:uncharacterized protein YjbI with pentapeptide repeats
MQEVVAMADTLHLQILEQGVPVWNLWRYKNPDTQPNLADAHLEARNLRMANLSGAYLMGADLHRANLSGASLQQADLQRADLHEASLVSLVFTEGAPELGQVELGAGAFACDFEFTSSNESRIHVRTNLEEANLSDADLRGATLVAGFLRGPGWGRLNSMGQTSPRQI